MVSKDYYVYVYSDPETRKPFYVGKGKRGRVLSHLKFTRALSAKHKKIKSIFEKGLRPIVEIVQWDLTDKESKKAEAALIQYFGIDNLTNEKNGEGVYKIHADFLQYIQRSGSIRIKDDGKRVLMLNVDSVYYEGISRYQLYDAARVNLKISEADRKMIDGECELAFAVLNGFVIDVYVKPKCVEARCDMCEHGGSEDGSSLHVLAGEASERLRNKYIGKKCEVLFRSPRRYRMVCI